MISIVIIVKDDPRIGLLLEKLLVVKKPRPTEFLVIDASRGRLDDIRKKYSAVRWIDYDPGTRKRTYAAQRNIGVSSARGSVIVFIDADCIPEVAWLTLLTQPIFDKKERIVSGSIAPAKGYSYHIRENYGSYRDEAETMNLAIEKSVFGEIGLFDETLEGCEDSDFCIRAKRAGIRIRHIPDAVVTHDWGGFKQNLIRSFHGGRDRQRLYAKYPELLISLSINNIYTLYYTAYGVFLPLSFIFPIYPLLLFLPSLIKRRNPIKEFFNLSFVLGLFYGLISRKLPI